MKSREYWQRRSEEIARLQYDKADEYAEKLKREYERAIQSIERDLVVFYERYAANNEITLAEARKILNSKELNEFRMSVEEFIRKAKNNADGRWTRELNNVYYKVRVSRLQALMTQIRQEVEMLTGSAQKGMKKLLEDVYKDTYYRTLFEVQRGTGIGVSFAKVDTQALEKILQVRWAGENYSQRIWNNRDKLVAELQTRLSQAFIRGESIDQTAKALAERMGVSYSSAERIIRTESSFIAHQATWDSYKASGVVEKYEYLATLDGRTSEICRSMDGKVFRLSEKQEGVNYPPLHPNCRSTVVPYFDDEIDPGERIARDETGKTYYVPGDMTYQVWYNRYVASSKLPKKLKTEDSYLPVQLRFKDEKGNQWFIPLNTVITDVHVIAGKGVSVAHRASQRLSQQYGGKPEEWSKKVGKIESDNYVFDIHWVEHPEIGGKEYKIAGRKVKK